MTGLSDMPKLFFGDLTPQCFADLRSKAGLDALDRDMLELGLKNSLLTMRCEFDAQSCGMLRIVGDGAFVLVLCDMLVLPSYRGRGIGSYMLAAALERARQLMPQGKWVSTLLTCAPERESFYGRHGFRVLGGGPEGISMQTFIRGS